MQELYRVLKPGGMGIFQIPQDLSREFTFSDDSITNQKERAAIFGQYDMLEFMAVITLTNFEASDLKS
jgi:hypothetical protein